MRLCRFKYQGRTEPGLYGEQHVVSLAAAAAAYTESTREPLALPASDDLLDFLPPHGSGFAMVRKLAAWTEQDASASRRAAIPTAAVELLVPIPRPNKIFLLAGNYAGPSRKVAEWRPNGPRRFPMSL